MLSGDLDRSADTRGQKTGHAAVNRSGEEWKGARRARFWVITVAAILTMAATASLGRWQLSRAAQKEAMQAESEAQSQRPELDQQTFLSTDKVADAMLRPVRLRGLWLGTQTVYLDNRQMHGVPGFYVLTPFALEGSNETVMVQRGWIQRNFENRTQLQPVQTPAGLVEVVGRIAPPPSHLMELGKAVVAAAPAAAASDASAASSATSSTTAPASATGAKAVPEGSSAIRQNLDLEAFRVETGLPLRTDLSLQQSGAASEGLQRDWPAPALGIERHYGYAFQWFALSALVAFLYVWFQLIAPWRKAGRARHG
ncbi:MAG: transrane cytochrome oxidase [Variovorax sp.]|nr:transrane cytochrome oxidase [Variovorax sp.]